MKGERERGGEKGRSEIFAMLYYVCVAPLVKNFTLAPTLLTFTLFSRDRTKTRNGLGNGSKNGSIKLRFVSLQVMERAFTVVV